MIMSVKHKNSSNPYMDSNVKMLLSIYKCVSGMMSVTHIETQKCHKLIEVCH